MSDIKTLTINGGTMTEFASTTEVPWKSQITNIQIVTITSTTNIGSNAFNGATSLQTVTLHNNMNKIGNNAFNGCSQLTSITLPTTLTTIGTNAFASSGLTQINIPSKVTSIGDK